MSHYQSPLVGRHVQFKGRQVVPGQEHLDRPEYREVTRTGEVQGVFGRSDTASCYLLVLVEHLLVTVYTTDVVVLPRDHVETERP